MARHMITGATGFIGTAVVLELADRLPDDHLTLIVRPQEDPATTRAHTLGVLAQACDAYNRPELKERLARTVEIVGADLTDGRARTQLSAPKGADIVWHLAGAAPGGLGEGKPDTTCALHMMNATQALRASQMVTLSSVFVQAGVKEPAEEKPFQAVGDPGPFTSGKLAVERAALQGGFSFQPVICRLGTVIGHSQTGKWAGTGTPQYVAALRRALELVKADQEKDPDEPVAAVAVPARPDALVNAIHVDHVARQMVSVGVGKADKRVYHLVSNAPLAMATVADRITTGAGMPPLLLDPGVTPVDGVQLAAARVLGAFRPVEGAVERVERAHVLAVTGMREACEPSTLERCVHRAAVGVG